MDGATMKEAVAKLKKQILRLPAQNLVVLRYLLHFLTEVVKCQEKNRMTSANLAIVFAPSLMRKKGNDEVGGLCLFLFLQTERICFAFVAGRPGRHSWNHHGSEFANLLL